MTHTHDRLAALDWTQAVHLVERRASGRTFCGLSLERIGPTRWTDAVRDVVENMKRADGTCRACLLRGEALVDAWDEADEREFQAEWRREIAREEGMLGGVDSYNDWMGY